MLERLTAIRDELLEVEHLPELKAIWCNWQADAPEVAGDVECSLMLRSTLSRLRLFNKEEIVVEKTQEEKLTELLHQLEATRAQTKPPVQRVARGGRRYQLLKMDVGWSTKPQVHALMKVLSAHAKEGDVLDEDHIIRMMVENEAVLQTRQGGKRIWDYYKGDHHEGLLAHGNVRKI